MSKPNPTIDTSDFWDDQIERIEVAHYDKEIIIKIGDEELGLKKRELELMLDILNEGGK